jgi:hypothetical protein
MDDILVGNISNGGVIASQTSETFSHNNNGEDVIVLVALRDARTADTITGVTYGGAAMAPDVSNHMQDVPSSTNGDLRTYIFRKQGAAAGANNVVVSFSGTVVHGAAFAVSVSGLNASGQPDATANAGEPEPGSEVAIDTQITTVAQKVIIFDVAYSKDNANFNVGTGRTQIGQLSPNGGDDRAFASYVIKSAQGTYTIDWADTNYGDDYSHSVVAYKAAGTNANVNASTLSTTASVQAPTKTALKEPSVLTSTTSIIAPTVQISATKQVSELTASTALQAPVPAVVKDPASLGSVASLQDPTIYAERHVNLTPAVLTALSSLPTSIWSISPNVNALSATASIQAVSLSITKSIAVLTATAGLESPNLSVTKAVSELVATASMLSPTVSVDADINFLASVLSTTASLQTPSPEVRKAISELAVTVNLLSTAQSILKDIGVLSAISSIESPSVGAAENVTVNAQVLSITASLVPAVISLLGPSIAGSTFYSDDIDEVSGGSHSLAGSTFYDSAIPDPESDENSIADSVVYNEPMP